MIGQTNYGCLVLEIIVFNTACDTILFHFTVVQVVIARHILLKIVIIYIGMKILHNKRLQQ